MYDKKGTAFEEFVGLGTFTFAIVIGLLLLFGCRVYKETQDYEAFEFSKDEIEAIKALNFFLEMPVDEERKVMGVIIKSYQDEDYCEFDKIAREHFSEIHDRWGFTIGLAESNAADYNSYECYALSDCEESDTENCQSAGDGSIVAESETKIPFLEENLELKELKVTLMIRE